MANAQPKRCGWVNVDHALMREYHDREWGVPIHDDRTQFEFLVLVAAQAGLRSTVTGIVMSGGSAQRDARRRERRMVPPSD